ncbi:MAG TPA: tetratricopeptide repeat protein [Thermoanaerobaculaceae bacterium]|nr:tetratricopeptide repeat protein [Thermoanaerobaculaceae bacterium]
MRRVVLAVVLVVAAATARGSVFERFLSPDRPADRAIMGYLELIKAGKATSMDYANVGVLILEKGFPGDAEDYLAAALKLDKHNYEAAYRLGLVLQREGRDREAVRYYKKTVKERPGYAQALFMLALAEERCGEREAAIHHYAKAYRHAPELANPKKNPLVYDSALQTEAALRHYQEVMRTSTLKVTEIDPATIRRMMEIKAPEAVEKPEAAKPAAQPAAATPGPAPTAAVSAPPRKPPAPPQPAATAGAGSPAQGTATQVQPGGKVLPGGLGGNQPLAPPKRATRPPAPPPPAATPTPEPPTDEQAPPSEPEPGSEPGSEPEPTPTPTPTR